MAIQNKGAVNNVERGTSILPSNAVQMGLLDNFDGVITDAKFTPWDYNGKSKEVLALAVEITPEDDKAFVQYYSAGEKALKNFNILPGNTRVKAVNAAVGGLPQNSNAVKFLGSLVSGGLTEDQMVTPDGNSDDVSVLVGVKAHFHRVANPKQAGMKSSDKDGGNDNTVLLVEKVIAIGVTVQAAAPASTPGKPAGKPNKANGKVVTPVAPAEPAPTVLANIDERAAELVLAKVAENGGSAKKQELAKYAYDTLAGDPARNSILTRIAQDTFLGQDGQPWSYDGSVVSL